MIINHLSIKNLTITILIVIGFISVLVAYISGDHLFKAAQDAELHSLNRVTKVAANEIMKNLHDQTYEIATNLSTQGPIPDSYTRSLNNNNRSEFINSLDEPFVSGFIGAYIIELVKIRAYDTDLAFIGESNKGVTGLPQKLPDFLYQQGHNRKGAARTRAISALWLDNDTPYYSVLVPIGGIFIKGYIEVVVNPINNLLDLSEKMNSPVSIRSVQNPGKVYYQPKESIDNLLPIEYILHTDDGKPAYLLSSYEDISGLNKGVWTVVYNAIALFLVMMLVLLIIAAGIFQLFLFNPLKILLKQIRHITDGNLSDHLEVKGLSEINILSDEFNKMAKEIRSREEKLVQLSVIDELTKIANRRKFDEVLEREYLNGCRSGKPLSLLMIDIDYFKRFNDIYGHLAGDDCIRKVAAALQGSVFRPTDLVARYGGEEFALILPNTPKNGERVVAEKIMSEIAKLNIAHSGSSVINMVTVSIGGYTLTPTIHNEPAFIVAEADKSLYQAKNAGRNRFVLRSDTTDNQS